MFSPLRNRFGIPGVISVIALVFAMLGGAYAASNDSGKATASAKAKKGPRGPKGPAGPAGPAGPQGPAGANGKDGANGSNGLDGEDGAKGATGAKGTNGTAGAKGATGAAGAKGATGAVGAAGATGEEGSPWTAGGTLPKGETETGAWSVGTVTEEVAPFPAPIKNPLLVSISFPIQLPAEVSITNVHFLEKGASATTECPGSAATPKAKAGHVCIYTADWTPQKIIKEEPVEVEGIGFVDVFRAGKSGLAGASQTGAIIKFAAWSKGSFAYGTWAVTAP